MERTVPRATSEEIELYLRTMYSLLRSTTEFQLRTLEEVHAGMNSLMHSDARSESFEAAAFIYSILRLPDCMPDVQLVILGQSASVFHRHGFDDIEVWEAVSARARRRRCYFNHSGTLACFIASRSDIEDVIPVMTAYQIEWNKLHFLLKRLSRGFDWDRVETDSSVQDELKLALNILPEDYARLQIVWGDRFYYHLKRIQEKVCAISVRQLSGSLSEYWRATRTWWENIERESPSLVNRPIYFVSSNLHSITNIVNSYALDKKEALYQFLADKENMELMDELKAIQSGEVPTSLENFLYYVLKKFQQSAAGKTSIEEMLEMEKKHGINRIVSRHSFDIDAQIIQLNSLNPVHFDPRLQTKDYAYLKQSDAIILNIDYPLGLAAYNILSKVAEHAYEILGIYIMGKAASLNGVLGDVVIPNVVHDEQSHNTYLFQNAFSANDVVRDLIYGSVLDNQKAISVLGTFLQNSKITDVFYREGYSDIEMEAGPYLSAVYEMVRPKRHPIDEIVNLYGAPFDIGILHYVSDNPLSKGNNLGAGTLSYFGMDPTYATSLAIIRRIFDLEEARTNQKGAHGIL